MSVTTTVLSTTLIWRARFWRSNVVAHVVDFTCVNPLLVEDALDAAIADLPASHPVWGYDAITVSPKANG